MILASRDGFLDVVQLLLATEDARMIERCFVFCIISARLALPGLVRVGSNPTRKHDHARQQPEDLTVFGTHR
jgi:hypothetical protein